MGAPLNVMQQFGPALTLFLLAIWNVNFTKSAAHYRGSSGALGHDSGGAGRGGIFTSVTCKTNFFFTETTRKERRDASDQAPAPASECAAFR